jgi:hypothetical protein
VRALAASPHLGRLAALYLEPGRLSAAAARALAGSPHLPAWNGWSSTATSRTR